MEKETAIKKVGEEQDLAVLDTRSEREKEVVGEVVQLFHDSARERDSQFSYFDNRNLIDYINDNVERFITNVDERDDIEDWQARAFQPFTRNKVMAILGKVAGVIPIPEFFSVSSGDEKRARILTDLSRHADSVDNTEELMFFALLEALVKGTVLGFEAYEEKVKPVRKVVSWDSSEKISVSKTEITTRKLTGSIVPLENFYPSSVGIRNIQDMPYCFVREVMSLGRFRTKFRQYEKAKFVPEMGSFASSEETRPFYMDYIYGDIPQGFVEVLRYFNQETDEFVIIANGVWLNPLGDEMDISPLPYNHKRLPFWKAIYEPLGADFFYGKSMVDKLKAMQDIINVLYNMMLDQSFLSIFPPILTDEMDEIEDDFLRPGRRIPVSDQSRYRELQISPPAGFHQFILEHTKRVMEETSIDAVNQGVAGVGERTTATEIQTAAQAVASLLGIFAKFVEWGVRDKARLRAANILQFYKKPLLEGVLGEGGTKEFNTAFNTFKIEDTTLTSGRRGVKIVQMFKESEMPTRTQLRAQKTIDQARTGNRVERVAISPDYLRNFEFDVRLVPNRAGKESKAMEKALVLEKTKVYMEFMPEFVDKEELAFQIAEAYGDDPRKIFKRNAFQEKEETNAGNLGVSENMAQMAMGEQSSGRSIRSMSQGTV